jgi:predicted anti-sigma-YlaC factor YlaD
MNCHDFNDRLYEYLDEALSHEDRAAAREHLRQCVDCRRALLREKAVAESIRHSFDRATTGLTVRPETHRKVLEALESTSAPSSAWLPAWQRWISIACRPVGAAAALLAGLVLFLGIQFHRQAGQGSGLQATDRGDCDTCVIDVPIHTQTRIFRRQNSAVVDAIIPNVTIGRAYFCDNSGRRSKPR